MDFNALQRDLQDAAAQNGGAGGNHGSHGGSHGGSSAGGGGSGHHGHHASILDVYEFVDELGHGAYGSVMKARKRKGHRQSYPRGGGQPSGGRKDSNSVTASNSSAFFPPGPSSSTSGSGVMSTTDRNAAPSSSTSSSEQFFAIKIIDKKKAGSKGLSEVMGEVETMMLLNHPNIVHLEETFQDDSTLWIVMEYVPGGELHKVLKRQTCFPEAIARQIIIQLLLAVEYIHQKGIVHRDLKPANMLLKDETDWQIKIADFGFAVLVGADNFLTSYCGTGAYMAPEIVMDMNYGKPVDIWAVGVILYLMIAGEYPFQAGPGPETLTDSIIANKWQSNAHPRMQDASPGAKDFLSKLLTTDPQKRVTAKEALKHTWIQTALQGLSHRLDAAAAGGGGRAGRGDTHRVPPLTRLKGWVYVIVAMNRMMFWRRLRNLRVHHADVPLLRSFSYCVTGRYEPPKGFLNAAGVFANIPRAIGLFLLPMVESSSTLDTLDLSRNNIESLDLVQNIVKSLMNHPSLTTLVLENNPIPALAGRGLVRLARASNRLRVLKLAGTQVGPDVMQQVAAALKEKKLPSGGDTTGTTTSSTTTGSGSSFGFPGSSMFLYAASSATTGQQSHERTSGGGGLMHSTSPIPPSTTNANSSAPHRGGPYNNNNNNVTTVSPSTSSSSQSGVPPTPPTGQPVRSPSNPPQPQFRSATTTTLLSRGTSGGTLPLRSPTTSTGPTTGGGGGGVPSNLGGRGRVSSVSNLNADRLPPLSSNNNTTAFANTLSRRR